MNNVVEDPQRPDEQVQGVRQERRLALLVHAVADELKNPAENEQGDIRTEGATEELPNDTTDWDEYLKWFNTLGCPRATMEDVANHVLHAAEVAGVDRVGIGSDFDGVPALPDDLQTAAGLPRLTARLLERGLSEKDVEKILGENFLRVFEEIEGAR